MDVNNLFSLLDEAGRMASTESMPSITGNCIGAINMNDQPLVAPQASSAMNASPDTPNSASQQVGADTGANVKKQPWKKPKDMPRRPLSAYNLFFQSERQRIVNAISKTRGPEQEEQKPKRSNRPKKLGIGFAGLARDIAKKWKELDKSERSVFEDRARAEKMRYQREVKIWKSKNQSQGKKKTKSKTATMTQASDSASSLSPLQTTSTPKVVAPRPMHEISSQSMDPNACFGPSAHGILNKSRVTTVPAPTTSLTDLLLSGKDKMVENIFGPMACTASTTLASAQMPAAATVPGHHHTEAGQNWLEQLVVELGKSDESLHQTKGSTGNDTTNSPASNQRSQLPFAVAGATHGEINVRDELEKFMDAVEADDLW